MDHERLAERIERRIDKVEEKLDKYFEVEVSNRTDLKWVKGYIKLGVLAILTLGAAIIPDFIKKFFS